MAEKSVVCPICNGALKAASEDELVKVLKEHAKHDHEMDMPEEKARHMVEEANHQHS